MTGAGSDKKEFLTGLKFQCHNPRTGEVKEDLLVAGNIAEKSESF